jgi:uncharacterized protein YhaN
MAAWLTAVQAVLKERTELRNMRIELGSLQTAIDAVRPALNALAKGLQVINVELLSPELASTAVDSALKALEDRETAASRLRTLVANADERRGIRSESEAKLAGELKDWKTEWQEALKSFHTTPESSVGEAEAALSAWGEFPALLKERNGRQRRIDGLEREMKAFEQRLLDVFGRLERLKESGTTYDTAARLLSKQLKLSPQLGDGRFGSLSQLSVQLRIANRLLPTLSLGRVTSEELDEKDSPRLVGRRDAEHTVCVEGMSKGTRDQLYLSLRLAYLEEYASKAESVPFIGDDLGMIY